MKWFTPIAAVAAAVVVGGTALAVGTSNWSHTTEADFKNGTFDNVVATNLGDLKLSRAVKTLLEQDPQVSAVNAMAEGPDGAVYAGTGPRGILMRAKGETVEKVAIIDDATNIFSLAFDKDGRLLIGTGGESGKILRVDKPASLKAIRDEEKAEAPGAEKTEKKDDKAKDDKPAGEKSKDGLKEIFSAEGVQYIWAIRQTPDGNLYAATGPTGQLWEIKPDGSKRVVLDSDENNLTALVSDGKDMLYVGTDPNGLLYRVNRKTGESFVLFDAPEAEISGLVIDAQGNIYASTAEAREEGAAAATAGAAEKNGRPEGGAAGVQITSEPPKEPKPPELPNPQPGKPEPIPKAVPTAPKPPANSGAKSERNPQSRLPRGFGIEQALLGIVMPQAEATDPEPSAPRRPPRAPAPPGAPKPGPGPSPGPNPGPGPGTAPTTGPTLPMPAHQPTVEPTAAEPKPEGNAVYKVDRDGFVTEIFRQPVLILSMVEREGQLLLATGSEGQVYQINPAAEETSVVAKVEPKQIMCLLPTSDGRVYLGTANVGGIAAMSSGYAAKGTYTSPVLDATQISRFGKMHLHGSVAEATSITVATRSGNVHDAAEKGWSKWTDEAPVTEFLQVESPPARFLQYRLTFTSKAGKTTPVIEDVNVAYQVPNLPPQIKAVRVQPASDPAAMAAAAAAAANGGEGGPTSAQPIVSSRKLTLAWEASDPNNDPLQFSVYFRRGEGSPWILLKDKLPEPTYEWDTRSVADGRYEVKVIASDAAANEPGKGKTASRVSDPVLVDNTPPVVGDLKSEQRGADVKVSFRAVDRTSVVAGAEYSVDSSKDWQAVLPSDNIWDSPEETAAFNIRGLQPGNHQVTIRATDAKGNQAFESIFVTVQGPAAAK
jgi:hypothetical protein